MQRTAGAGLRTALLPAHDVSRSAQKQPDRCRGWFHPALYFGEILEEVVRTGRFCLAADPLYLLGFPQQLELSVA